VKEVVGKVTGDRKLASEGNQVNGKVQNAVGGLKDPCGASDPIRRRTLQENASLCIAIAAASRDELAIIVVQRPLRSGVREP
jgi:hypothetical protein